MDKSTFECAELKYEEESSEEEITSTEESADSQETDIVIPEPQVVEEKYTADIPENYSTRDMAEDQAKAMKALGIANANVMGVSQGGMIAQYLAIDHPELVRKLISYSDKYLKILYPS